MSRYIDADEAVTMIALQMPFIIQGFEDNKRTAQRIIGSMPSIGIVFCKDCKIREDCPLRLIANLEYCSIGEME